MNIVADVAGEYDAVVRLLEKMPKERTVFLGDLIDRGPKSCEVVALVREKHECVLANHEHFMIDWVRKTGIYEQGIWLANGGRATLASYGCDPFEEAHNSAMEEDVKWMESLPLYIETDDLFLSHAPWRQHTSLEDACRLTRRGFMNTVESNDFSLLWCRDVPEEREINGKQKIQMFGHNSMWGIEPFPRDSTRNTLDVMKDYGEIDQRFFNANVSQVQIAEPIFALCLDNSWMRRVTGAHFDEEKKTIFIYQENY